MVVPHPLFPSPSITSDLGDILTKKAVTQRFLKIHKSNKKLTDGASTLNIGTAAERATTKPRATPVNKTNGKGSGVKTPTLERKA